MCGRFSLHAPPDEIARIVAVPPDVVARVVGNVPRYNIVPTTRVAALRGSEQEGGRELVSLRWGLVPRWAKEIDSGPSLINARAETVAEKPSFRKAYENRRCVVLADGYYEWQRLADRKQPFYFQVNDGELFGFAGIWERWARGGDRSLESCAIITTRANDFAKPVHERMPVIIRRETWGTWLRQDFSTAEHDETLRSLLHPLPPGNMNAYPVSTLVNSPGNDVPQCVEPVGPPLRSEDVPQ